MRSNKLFLIALFLLGLLVIKNILRLYYFPSDGLELIQAEFSNYALIIEIIMILICLSLIPGFYILRKASKESESFFKGEKFVTIILMLSALPLVFALLITYLLGDALFAVGLLVYGILFGVLTYFLRI
jgi:phosphotransferase system  glucose/maltose/N-acetylglucosamine-specific IIC component